MQRSVSEPVGTGSTSISKEVATAFDAIRKTKDIKTIKLTAMGIQIEARNMRAILNAIEAFYFQPISYHHHFYQYKNLRYE